jgi:hypothetical protein
MVWDIGAGWTAESTIGVPVVLKSGPLIGQCEQWDFLTHDTFRAASFGTGPTFARAH